jgi:hypothetical protein
MKSSKLNQSNPPGFNTRSNSSKTGRRPTIVARHPGAVDVEGEQDTVPPHGVLRIPGGEQIS